MEREYMTQEQIEETFQKTEFLCEKCGECLYHDVTKKTLVCLECGFEEELNKGEENERLQGHKRHSKGS